MHVVSVDQPLQKNLSSSTYNCGKSLYRWLTLFSLLWYFTFLILIEKVIVSVG